ncbi:MAG: OmpA family protein [Desulfovibrionaceae bacterium]|nr:OmpA family protein [Desulfovibrionaceae bacterium]
MPPRARDFPQPARPPWLIIFTDIVTLMLTFFIIMAAVSVVDYQDMQRAAASVRGAFGLSSQELWQNEQEAGSAGRLYTRPHGAHTPDGGVPNESRLFADNPHVAARYTETEITISMPAHMLFEGGESELGEAGRHTLDRISPFLRELTHPVLVAGYSAQGFGEGWNVFSLDGRTVDFSWAISLNRALAVYRHLSARGANPAMLRVEGYGRYRPDFDNLTPEGRRKNRRVDLVIDRRNPNLRGLLGNLRLPPEQGQEYHFRDFQFNLDLPGGSPARRPEN